MATFVKGDVIARFTRYGVTLGVAVGAVLGVWLAILFRPQPGHTLAFPWWFCLSSMILACSLLGAVVGVILGGIANMLRRLSPMIRKEN